MNFISAAIPVLCQDKLHGVLWCSLNSVKKIHLWSKLHWDADFQKCFKTLSWQTLQSYEFTLFPHYPHFLIPMWLLNEGKRSLQKHAVHMFSYIPDKNVYTFLSSRLTAFKKKFTIYFNSFYIPKMHNTICSFKIPLIPSLVNLHSSCLLLSDFWSSLLLLFFTI